MFLMECTIGEWRELIFYISRLIILSLVKQAGITRVYGWMWQMLFNSYSTHLRVLVCLDTFSFLPNNKEWTQIKLSSKYPDWFVWWNGSNKVSVPILVVSSDLVWYVLCLLVLLLSLLILAGSLERAGSSCIQ